MHVRLPEGGVAFGTFALPRIVSGLQAIVAEDVKTLGENGIALFVLTRWTTQDLLVLSDLFEQHFVFVRGHLQLPKAFEFPIENLRFLLQSSVLEVLLLQGFGLLGHQLLHLFQLRVISIEMQFQVGGGLGAFDGLAFVRVQCLMQHVQFFLQNQNAVAKQGDCLVVLLSHRHLEQRGMPGSFDRQRGEGLYLSVELFLNDARLLEKNAFLI